MLNSYQTKFFSQFGLDTFKRGMESIVGLGMLADVVWFDCLSTFYANITFEQLVDHDSHGRKVVSGVINDSIGIGQDFLGNWFKRGCFWLWGVWLVG